MKRNSSHSRLERFGAAAIVVWVTTLIIGIFEYHEVAIGGPLSPHLAMLGFPISSLVVIVGILAIVEKRYPTAERSFEKKKRKKKAVSTAPGWCLLRILSWVYSEKTFKRVFLQTIRDMQRDHLEALAGGDARKVRWVLLRGYWSVWSAVVAQMPVSMLKLLFELWRAAS